jgi:hypothetical protein
MSQFRNKTEAQQAIQDMEDRAGKAVALAAYFDAGSPKAREHLGRSAECRAEARRIRALLHTLPD